MSIIIGWVVNNIETNSHWELFENLVDKHRLTMYNIEGAY